MISVFFFICFSFSSVHAQQSYDSKGCSSEEVLPGSRYTCNSSSSSSCKTFLVFRANQDFQTLWNISNLFQTKPNELLQLNNLSSTLEILKPGREVLVPITCHCSDSFFQANFSYEVQGPTSSRDIACGVFEGLVKSKTLIEENQIPENGLNLGENIRVPLKCACPDDDVYVGVTYLVTYPFVQGDTTGIVSKKFGISEGDLWTANHFVSMPTVFPETTFLVPLKEDPAMDFTIPDPPPPSPGTFLPTLTIDRKTKSMKLKNLIISVSVVGIFVVVVALLVCGLYIKALRRLKHEKLESFKGNGSPFLCSTPLSTPWSSNSCLSPDFLAGIRFSLHNYSVEDVRRSTKDFSEESKISEKLFKGVFGDTEVLIREMKFDDTRSVIDVHSKINHKNIVNLHGVCYREDDAPWSYLMFEFPSNGCLRDSLVNPSTPLDWKMRIRIAFDTAMALNYLHNCIFPSVVHLNINCRNIFLTADFRAKLGNIGSDRAASDKIDIFAFGVVMLELISGREVEDRKQFKDSIGFLGGADGEGGCFDQLKLFVDPMLETYHLAEALCWAVLAKACVEDDPLHRPTMDDIIKVLGKMI